MNSSFASNVSGSALGGGQYRNAVASGRALAVNIVFARLTRRYRVTIDLLQLGILTREIKS